MSTDLTQSQRRLSYDERAAIRTMDDALALLGAKTLADIDSAADYGDGFIQADKADLCGVPLILLEWSFSVSDDYFDDQGNPAAYVVARGITAANVRFWFTDGSTGVCAQLRRITESREAAGDFENSQIGLRVNGGLVKSRFTTTKDGEKVKGVVYYLSEA